LTGKGVENKVQRKTPMSFNKLESEVGKVNNAIEKVKTNESFELIQEDLVKLEAKLADL
jgi:hypothetical protein